MGHHHRAMRFPKVSVIQNRGRASAQSSFPRLEGASAGRGIRRGCRKLRNGKPDGEYRPGSRTVRDCHGSVVCLNKRTYDR